MASSNYLPHPLCICWPIQLADNIHTDKLVGGVGVRHCVDVCSCVVEYMRQEHTPPTTFIKYLTVSESLLHSLGLVRCLSCLRPHTSTRKCTELPSRQRPARRTTCQLHAAASYLTPQTDVCGGLLHSVLPTVHGRKVQSHSACCMRRRERASVKGERRGSQSYRMQNHSRCTICCCG